MSNSGGNVVKIDIAAKESHIHVWETKILECTTLLPK